MPHTKSVSVLFLPKSPPLIKWMNDQEFQIRHSQSDPLIHSSRNQCRLYIESADNECGSELSDIDTNLLYPHWFTSPSPSSQSLSSMDSTISAEDLIHEMVTIEGLRTLYNSCFTCGVSWHQNHVTLDCIECGGYAMERPCPQCDGRCGEVWRRNLTASHDNHKAKWEGECKLIASSIQKMAINEMRDSTNLSNN